MDKSLVPNYEILARVYDAALGEWSDGFLSFLKKLQQEFGFSMDSVLDLACGTGNILCELAPVARRLLGLDISPEMLAVAREKTGGLGNVRLVQGSYETFEFDEVFDLILCNYDSINYLERPGDLGGVLSRVHQHLGPRGCFLFDAVDERHYRENDGITETLDAHGVQFEYTTLFDEKKKKGITVMSFKSCEELHVQVPIEYKDVKKAARRAGFQVLKVCANMDGVSRDEESERLFYLLGKE